MIRTRQSPRTPTIGVDGIGKSYAGVPVLHDVSLEIPPGEIHGLLGENGAGKSTLLRILGGAIVPDAGTVRIEGAPVRFAGPRDSIAHGVSLISQELAVVPDRTVLENVFLGNWRSHAGLAGPRADLGRYRALVDEVGFELDPMRRVRTLSVGQRQQVEILRALARGSRVLCFDEPTATLDEADTEHLLAVLRGLAAEQRTVILVSHFLDEVLALADRVTVLRDGAQITTAAAAHHTPSSLVRLMVGRDVQALAARPEPVEPAAPVVFRAHGLTNAAITDVSFEVRRGEIVGLAGLVGSGRTETLRAIFGVDPLQRGEITVDGLTVRRHSVPAAIARGIALVPESRKDEGLVLGRDAVENVALPTLGSRQLAGVVRGRAERRAAGIALALVDVRGAAHRLPVQALSGGNQQKAMFAKWLVDPPTVLLVDEPTRGVDIAAKANIHQLVLDLAARGTAVVVVSSDLEEVMALAHRLLVLRRGRVCAEFALPADRQEVMSAAFHQEPVR